MWGVISTGVSASNEGGSLQVEFLALDAAQEAFILLKEQLKPFMNLLQVKKLKVYRGDVSKLSLADSFVYQLILLPR